MPNKIYTRLFNDVDMSWQEYAACRGIITDGTIPGDHDEVIFPIATNKTRNDDPTVEFRRIMCDSCPVRETCLEFALENGYTGAWGGELVTADMIRRWRMRPRQRTA